MNKRTENCFWCGYLGKELVECTADKSVKINPFLLLDEYPEDCPKKKGVVMEYKGFRTTNVVKETIEGIDIYSAVVENSSRYLKFKANSLEDVVESFHKCIDDYLIECEQIGIDPFQKR